MVRTQKRNGQTITLTTRVGACMCCAHEARRSRTYVRTFSVTPLRLEGVPEERSTSQGSGEEGGERTFEESLSRYAFIWKT